MKTKLRLCRYPNNGFGELNNKYYFLDQFGNKYITEYRYDTLTDHNDIFVDINGEYYGKDLDALINVVSANFKISKW